MTKERLQQHMDAFNKMCSELEDTEELRIIIGDSPKNKCILTVRKGDSILSTTLAKTSIIKIGKDE